MMCSEKKKVGKRTVAAISIRQAQSNSVPAKRGVADSCTNMRKVETSWERTDGGERKSNQKNDLGQQLATPPTRTVSEGVERVSLGIEDNFARKYEIHLSWFNTLPSPRRATPSE